MTNKKSLLSIQALVILMNDSSKEKTMTIDEINKELGRPIDSDSRGTVAKSIKNTLEIVNQLNDINGSAVTCYPIKEENDFKGNYSQWKLYYDHIFTQHELNILLLLVMQNQDIDKSYMIEKLITLSGADSNISLQTKLDQKHLKSFKNSAYQISTLESNIEILTSAMPCKDDGKIIKGKKITFKLRGYDENYNRTTFKYDNGKDRIYTVKPFCITMKDGEIILIAKSKNTLKNTYYDNYSIYYVNLIYDIKIGDEFDDEPLVNETKNRYLKEHFNMSYDQAHAVYLKIKKGNIASTTRLYRAFRDSAVFDEKATEKYKEKCKKEYDLFLVHSSLYGIVNWVFANVDAKISFMLDKDVMTNEKAESNVELVKIHIKDKLSGFEKAINKKLI